MLRCCLWCRHFRSLMCTAASVLQGLSSLGTDADLGQWQALFRDTDAFCSGWLSYASTLLEALSGPSHRLLSPVEPSPSPPASSGAERELRSPAEQLPVSGSGPGTRPTALSDGPEGSGVQGGVRGGGLEGSAPGGSGRVANGEPSPAARETGLHSRAAAGDSGRVRREGVVRHVAVTQGQLIPSLMKLMLYKLDNFFSAEGAASSTFCIGINLGST